MTCSRCKIHEVIQGQRWCRSCFTEYARANRKLHNQRVITKARSEATLDLREFFEQTFQKMGLQELNGVTVAEIIRRSDTSEITHKHIRQTAQLPA